jgi:hypothetical protein
MFFIVFSYIILMSVQSVVTTPFLKIFFKVIAILKTVRGKNLRFIWLCYIYVKFKISLSISTKRLGFWPSLNLINVKIHSGENCYLNKIKSLAAQTWDASPFICIFFNFPYQWTEFSAYKSCTNFFAFMSKAFYIFSSIENGTPACISFSRCYFHIFLPLDIFCELAKPTY